MGYYGGSPSGGGTGDGAHNHANKAVLDQLSDPGSGNVVTDAERQNIATFTAGIEDDWAGSVPATKDEAIARLARVLKQHLGTSIPEL